MPYIPNHNREAILCYVKELLEEIDTVGGFAYALTELLRGMVGSQPDFHELSKILGVYESVKLEYYRRLMAPYEDRKCAENGDVF